MKQNQFNFGEKMGEKFIETPSLLIKKNIMTWDNTVIQLSNISYISAADIGLAKFPGWAALVILGGLLLLGETALLAILLVAAGAVGVYFWYKENEKRRQGAILTIRMNSGHNLYFTFEEKAFLLKVLNVLETIIINGGTNNQVKINISDCTITGHARVLNGIED